MTEKVNSADRLFQHLEAGRLNGNILNVLQAENRTLEEMSAFFNNRAGIYDTVHPEHLGGGMESKRVIASFLPEHTKTLVDFGIGTGLELEAILKRFPDIEITGLDIAEQMLAKLREKYRGDNIKLYCESYLTYDFGNLRYDAAISLMTLHHYDRKTKTGLYRRIHDCLVPNGVYVECDYMLHGDDYENAQEVEDFNFSEYRRLKEELGITDGREYHFDTPCTVENQKKMLTDAGFAGVKEAWHTGNTVILVANKA